MNVMAKAAEPLKIFDDGAGVRRLTLDAPPANLLTSGMIDDLAQAVGDAADETVRVVVIAAKGPMFSAGHDLRALAATRADGDGGRGALTDLFNRCADLMMAIGALPKPVIAEVGGLATAAGCQLAVSCDMVVAAETARFGANGIDVGFFCLTPMVALERCVVPKVALEMLMSGAMIDAHQAHAAGLVGRVVATERLRDEVDQLSQTLCAKPARILALGKAAFRERLDRGIAERYRAMTKAAVDNLMMPEPAEGIAAFLGKRPPEWPSG